MNKNVILCVVLLFLGQIVVWYQLNSQLVWDWAKTTKSMWFMSLMGVPISVLFWYTTKFGYEGFGELWPIRLLGFATGMISFPIITWLMIGEGITLKTGISILLAIIIIERNIDIAVLTLIPSPNII